MKKILSFLILMISLMSLAYAEKGYLVSYVDSFDACTFSEDTIKLYDNDTSNYWHLQDINSGCTYETNVIFSVDDGNITNVELKTTNQIQRCLTPESCTGNTFISCAVAPNTWTSYTYQDNTFQSYNLSVLPNESNFGKDNTYSQHPNGDDNE